MNYFSFLCLPYKERNKEKSPLPVNLLYCSEKFVFTRPKPSRNEVFYLKTTIMRRDLWIAYFGQSHTNFSTIPRKFPGCGSSTTTIDFEFLAGKPWQNGGPATA